MNEEKQYKLKNGESYIIRDAVEADAKKMIDYLDRISDESDNLTFGKGELTITVEKETEFIRSAIESPNQFFVVAIYKDEIIGNLNFSAGIKPRICHTGEFGVSVVKEFWGNGVAQQLLNSMIQWAKSNQQIKKINLQVRDDNDKAIALYKKLGFEVEGHIRRTMYVNGVFVDSFAMGLML